MKLLIQTQVYENYGDANEPYWKPKGGADYVVKKFKDFNAVTETVMALRSQIEQDNEYFEVDDVLTVVFVVLLDLWAQGHHSLCDTVVVLELLDHIVRTAFRLPVGLIGRTVVLVHLGLD